MNIVVIIFGYNRPDNLNKVLMSLERCAGFKSFPYRIFVDGAHTVEDVDYVCRSHKVVVDFEARNPDLKVERYFRDSNVGLKANIQSGLSDASRDFDAFIVLEDDVIPGEYFLEFHRRSLMEYRRHLTVKHVNGWSYPGFKYISDDVTFVTMMSCWGWSTWSDRWIDHERRSVGIRDLRVRDRVKFNRYFSCTFFSHLYGNYTGERSTWAVFWMLHIFLLRGICIMPKYPVVTNIGFNDGGTHNERVSWRLTDCSFQPKKFPSKPTVNLFADIAINCYHFLNTPVASLMMGALKCFKKVA